MSYTYATLSKFSSDDIATGSRNVEPFKYTRELCRSDQSENAIVRQTWIFIEMWYVTEKKVVQRHYSKAAVDLLVYCYNV